MHAPPHTFLWVGRISSGMAVTTHIPGTRRITEETVWACPPEKWREGGPHPSDFSTRSGALASPGAVQGPSLVNPGSTLSPRALLVLLALTSKTSFKLMLPLHHTGQRRRAPAHLFDNMVITKWDSGSPTRLYGGARGSSRRVSSKGQEMQGVSSDQPWPPRSVYGCLEVCEHSSPHPPLPPPPAPSARWLELLPAIPKGNQIGDPPTPNFQAKGSL